MEIIAELEQSPRGPYGGAVGYISFHGNMDMAITIRTASIENGKLTVQAGAGIVADSDPERERTETVNKAMAMQKALQLVQKNTTQISPETHKRRKKHDLNDRQLRFIYLQPGSIPGTNRHFRQGGPE